jgi:quercetin dioxygenase-like cupin family protein
MTEKRTRASVLEACVATPRALDDLIDYAPDSIVSKTILDKPVGTITLFAFDEGQQLSEHTAPYDAVVQVIEGRGQLTIGGQPVTVAAGQVVIMPGNVPHSVTADERFKMLLTMIRA